ncbi:MAG: anthranilate phosphoribosyltransferase [Enterococcus sp.]
MQKIFEKIYQQQDLTTTETVTLAKELFTGRFREAQIASCLIGLKIKGATSDELTGFAQVMQQKATKMLTAPAKVMDNCGTGGDHSNSFNVSTTAAFVLAGGGIPMAKHGNRSISSKSGSADVLEALGVDLDINAKTIDFLLKEVGIAFLFAPTMHPVMKHVMKVRKELATPTIFNLLGPLINPYPLENQLMGTYAADSLIQTAETLGKLGRKQAIVVHGASGMDEANLSGTTQYAFYRKGKVETFEFTPEEVGLTRAPLSAIVGGGVTENKEILLNVLSNKQSVHLETVVLNAGLGFLASGDAHTVEEGIALARQSIQSGTAYDCLQNLIKRQKEVS